MFKNILRSIVAIIYFMQARMREIKLSGGVPDFWKKALIYRDLPGQSDRRRFLSFDRFWQWDPAVGVRYIFIRLVETLVFVKKEGNSPLLLRKLRRNYFVLFVSFWTILGLIQQGTTQVTAFEVYRIKEGDMLDIHKIDSPADIYRIPPDGRLFIPTLGPDAVIETLGKTIFEVADEIRKAQNVPNPERYSVKPYERNQDDVMVIGAVKTPGTQSAAPLFEIIAKTGGGDKSWNGKISVYFPDEKITRIYKVKELMKAPYQNPFIPRGSVVEFKKSWIYRIFEPIQPAATWVGVAALVAVSLHTSRR